MCPNHAMNDAPNRRYGQRIFARERWHIVAAIRVPVANGYNVIRAQARHSICLAPRRTARMKAPAVSIPPCRTFGVSVSPVRRAAGLSALGYLVGLIVDVRAKKQMRRVTAQTIVAAVAHTKPVRASGICQHPRNAMGAIHSPCNFDLPIPTGSWLPHPSPTSIGTARSVNLRPESRSHATIGVKHWNLHSGGPVGVRSTATGNLYADNYSMAGVE